MKNKPNKLYLCYAGTGKSHLAKEHSNFIDLDSSTFKKDDNWVGNYCRTAKHLLKTHNVLMSCHLPVRKYLTKAEIDYTLVYPDIELSLYWGDLLKKRADESGWRGDYSALTAHLKWFKHWFYGMENDKLHNKIVIKKESRFLEDVLAARGKL